MRFLVVLAITLCGSAALAGIKAVPRPLGLRLGSSVAAAEKLLRRHGAAVRTRTSKRTTPSGKSFERAKISARFSKGPFRRVKLYFFNKLLARIKVYGKGVRARLTARLGKPDYAGASRKHWTEPRRFQAVSCSDDKCELFDMGLLIGKVATKAEVEKEYARFVIRAKRRPAP